MLRDKALTRALMENWRRGKSGKHRVFLFVVLRRFFFKINTTNQYYFEDFPGRAP